MSADEMTETKGAALDELATKANEAHREALGTAGEAILAGLRCGEYLTGARARLGHGEWLPWLEEHFDSTRQTAAAYIRLAANKEVVLANIGRILHLRDMLKLLAAPKDGALRSSESNEWYTPAKYVEAARGLMGRVDLDPASCAEAAEAVGAQEWYGEEEDGLSRQWRGRVWLNPPYGKNEQGESNQGVWSRRLVAEFEAGRVEQAVLLCNAQTAERWFRPLWERAICFTDHRIKFVGAGAVANQPTHGNALVYFGEAIGRFVELFSEFGHCVIPLGGHGESVRK